MFCHSHFLNLDTFLIVWRNGPVECMQARASCSLWVLTYFLPAFIQWKGKKNSQLMLNSLTILKYFTLQRLFQFVPIFDSIFQFSPFQPPNPMKDQTIWPNHQFDLFRVSVSCAGRGLQEPPSVLPPNTVFLDLSNNRWWWWCPHQQFGLAVWHHFMKYSWAHLYTDFQACFNIAIL